MVHQNPLEGLLKHMVGPIPSVSDSVDLSGAQEFAFLNKFLRDSDAAGLWTVL